MSDLNRGYQEMLKINSLGLFKAQRGAAAVEFALIALMFFVLLLGIIEIGRALFVWNTLQEATRRAAREAVVSCTDNNTITRIKRHAVFGNGEATTHLPAAYEVADTNVVIQYSNDSDFESIITPPNECPNENIQVCLSDPADSGCIRYVRASINDATYLPWIGQIIGWPSEGIPMPNASVVMPAESLGFL
jgi:Flp pilus assembly protein TadG